MALLATSRSGKRRRCTSSLFRVAMKLSAMALCPGRSPSFPSKERGRPLRGACQTRSPCTGRRDRNDVRVPPTACASIPPSPGHRLRALCPHVRVHRPPDNPARMGVHDEGQVEKALSRRYVRDVRQPDPVGLSGHEVPAKQVWCGSSPRITASSSTLLTPHTALEPGGFHQPCYSLQTPTDPKRAKLCVYARVAVSLAAPTMDLADLLGEKGVLPPPLRERPAAPGVVTALGDSKHPA